MKADLSYLHEQIRACDSLAPLAPLRPPPNCVGCGALTVKAGPRYYCEYCGRDGPIPVDPKRKAELRVESR